MRTNHDQKVNKRRRKRFIGFSRNLLISFNYWKSLDRRRDDASPRDGSNSAWPALRMNLQDLLVLVQLARTITVRSQAGHQHSRKHGRGEKCRQSATIGAGPVEA